MRERNLPSSPPAGTGRPESRARESQRLEKENTFLSEMPELKVDSNSQLITPSRKRNTNNFDLTQKKFDLAQVLESCSVLWKFRPEQQGNVCEWRSGK